MTLVSSGPYRHYAGFLTWRRNEYCASYLNSSVFTFKFWLILFAFQMYWFWPLFTMDNKNTVNYDYSWKYLHVLCFIQCTVWHVVIIFQKIKSIQQWKWRCTEAQVIGVRVEFIALQCYFNTSKQNYPCFNQDKFDVYIGCYWAKNKQQQKLGKIIKAENHVSYPSLVS